MEASFIILTDFFTVYPEALAYTTSLAAAQQARVVLLHVCHNGLHGPGEKGSPRTEWNKRQKQRELARLTTNRPVPTELVVSEEVFPEAVGQTVRAQQGQLLVLGQPGAAEQPVEIVADVAQLLLEQALCPVLVVPPTASEGLPPRRLLLAVDGEPLDLHPLPALVHQLLAGPQASLQVVYIPESATTPPDPVAVLNTIRINGVVPAIPLSRLHLHHAPDLVAGILAEAVRQQADMLVVVARHHSLIGSFFHRSITARLMEQSPIPVLALPARD
ncbi:universal stress protein [Hymenobacter siberiensis]|uniref:universal stress protein n=1 Tax=Hymenobacter siberiensis TaxID=2848396 RepID=UPI001C1E49F3|nr:universal stress protein [Hymenobacter siberiensis]MBU6123265.1 universal stress protein [Hymenobacter siberiensis]